jgi:hypothetical protein
VDWPAAPADHARFCRRCRQPGQFAIAAVTLPKATLLGTFVVQREPLSFTREHVGF